MNILDSLDETQRKAATFGQGALLLVAGPGAGKTKVLTTRMAYLISQGVHPSKILMLTFTKSAGEEMASRVARLTGISQDILAKNVMTFHSLGARILMAYRWALPFKLAAEPIQPYKCRIILSKICQDTGQKYAIVRSQISLFKRHDLGPEDAFDGADNEGNDLGVLYARLYEKYEAGKAEQGLLDFDDLIFLAGRMLREKAQVRERYQETLDYFMVDEFPDTDISQMRLLDAIVKPKNNICVVGDVSQSIYGWRGGDLDLFLNFKDWYPGHQTILLARNYRSCPPIIDCYKKVITGAPSVVEGFMEAITAHREGGPEVQMWTSGDEAGESELVSAHIKNDIYLGRQNDLLRGGERSYAILVRTNRQMRILEDKLSAAAVPYAIIGSSSFFNRPEVKSVLAYLRVLEDPADNDAMEQVIRGKSHLTKYLGKAYADLLRGAGGKSMFEALPTTGKPWQRQKGAEIYRFFETVEREYGKKPVGDQIQVIVARAGIIRILSDEEDLDEVDNSVEENIQELIKAAASYESRESFLAYADMLSNKPAKGDAPVKMLTVHRAKGREFDVVYVCGFNDDILPHKRAEDVEEERRIAYVAISRAKDELILSSYGIRSRFLDALESEEVEDVESHISDGEDGEVPKG